MQPIGGKKASTLCILKILQEHASAEHPLTQNEIIRRLSDDYGVEIARNAVGRNLSQLKELGYDIQTVAGGSYYTPDFDDAELLVLMDSVLTSRYIPASDAQRLIEKLAALSNKFFRKKLPHVYLASDWPHQRNRQFFLNLELIGEAVKERRQLKFQYNRVGTDGFLHPARGRLDRVHPFELVCSNAQYYLIAGHRGFDNLRHYRVDRMTEIEILDAPARPVTQISGFEKGLDLAKYCRSHSFMYGGEPERVVMRMPQASAGDVTDAFGSAVSMEPLDEDTMKVTVFAAASGMRFFALQFAGVCEVLEPKHLREAIKQDVKALMSKYGVEA